MNIGLVVWEGAHAYTQFLEQWDRLRPFAGRQLDFARESAEDLKDKLARLNGQTSIGDEIERMARDLNHSIQLTSPRGSLEAGPELLERLAERYLQEKKPKRRARRGKRHNRRFAADSARRILRDAVERHLPGRVEELVHARSVVDGQLQEHEFDVVLANGTTRAALDALSFAVGSRQSLQRAVDGIAWALHDVRKKSPKLPLAVYAIRPTTADGRAVLEIARRTYAELNAELIESANDLKAWSRAQVELLNSANSNVKKERRVPEPA